MRSWKEALAIYGQPKRGKVYVCELESYTSGKVLTEDLKYISKDDCTWRTADDNSEINEMNWQVISWKEKS